MWLFFGFSQESNRVEINKIIKKVKRARKILSGTISTKNCKGLSVELTLTCCCIETTFVSSSKLLILKSNPFPGPIWLTKNKPRATEQKVVVKYNNTVLEPIFPRSERFDKPDTPLIMENNTNGTAINFNSFKKILSFDFK